MEIIKNLFKKWLFALIVYTAIYYAFFLWITEGVTLAPIDKFATSFLYLIGAYFTWGLATNKFDNI